MQATLHMEVLHMNKDDIHRSLIDAMLSMAKGTELIISMMNGEEIILGSNAVPLIFNDVGQTMNIGDDTTGVLTILNLEQVAFVKYSVPKKGERSNIQNVLDNLRKMADDENYSKAMMLLRKMFSCEGDE